MSYARPFIRFSGKVALVRHADNLIHQTKRGGNLSRSRQKRNDAMHDSPTYSGSATQCSAVYARLRFGVRRRSSTFARSTSGKADDNQCDLYVVFVGLLQFKSGAAVPHSKTWPQLLHLGFSLGSNYFEAGIRLRC
jgi:hypothetical protein